MSKISTNNRNKRLKIETETLEKLNINLNKKLKIKKTFLNRIDLEYDIWCMKLSYHLNHIIDMIDEIYNNHASSKLISNETHDQLKQHTWNLIYDLCGFMLYISIDSNHNELKILNENLLYNIQSFDNLIDTLTLNLDSLNNLSEHTLKMNQYLKTKLNALKKLIIIYTSLSSFQQILNRLTSNESLFNELNSLEYLSKTLLSIANNLNDEYKKQNFIMFNLNTQYDELSFDSSKQLNMIHNENEKKFLANLNLYTNETISMHANIALFQANLTILHLNQVLHDSKLFELNSKLIIDCQNLNKFFEMYLNTRGLPANMKLYENILNYTFEFQNLILNQIRLKELSKYIHPFVQLTLITKIKINENINEKKLINDYKSMLYIIKLLQYCSLLAYIIDKKQNLLNLKDYNLIFKELMFYMTYLTRCHTLILTELCLYHLKIPIFKSIKLKNFNEIYLNLPKSKFNIIGYINNTFDFNNEINKIQAPLTPTQQIAKQVSQSAQNWFTALINFSLNYTKPNKTPAFNQYTILDPDRIITLKKYLFKVVNVIIGCVKKLNKTLLISNDKIIDLNFLNKVYNRLKDNSFKTIILKWFVFILVKLFTLMADLNAVNYHNYQQPAYYINAYNTLDILFYCCKCLSNISYLMLK